MSHFRKTTHLSEILEESNDGPVIIFKFSSECGSSTNLSRKIEENILNKTITNPVYKVTVQTELELSKKISDWFEVKHESPQIIIINHGKVTYTEHHRAINIEKFSFK